MLPCMFRQNTFLLSVVLIKIVKGKVVLLCRSARKREVAYCLKLDFGIKNLYSTWFAKMQILF